MSFCTACGSEKLDSAQFCTNCGASTAVAMSKLPEPTASQSLWYVTVAGQSTGPLNEDAVRAMVLQQQIGPVDGVRAEGCEIWVPVTQSKFAPLVAQQTNLNRLTASTCPRCGAAMAVVIRRSTLGLVLVVLGICLTPLFGLGIPIFIVGYIMRFSGKGQAAYQCPRCNYSS